MKERGEREYVCDIVFILIISLQSFNEMIPQVRANLSMPSPDTAKRINNKRQKGLTQREKTIKKLHVHVHILVRWQCWAKYGAGSTQGGSHIGGTCGRLEGETDRTFLLIAVLPVINDLP